MIPDGNESLGPKFYDKKRLFIFVGSMMSSNDVINLSIFQDVIEVGKLSKTIFLKSFYHSRYLKKKIMGIGLLEKKLEGGGANCPPPPLAMQPLGKQPA